MSQSQVLLFILVAVAGGVIVVLALGMGERDASAPARATARKSQSRLNRAQRVRLLLSLVVGVVGALATGLWILMILVPALVFGVPWLLRGGGSQSIERLDALEAWTRSLAGLTVINAGLERILAASRDNCPDPIQPEVTRLVARISSRVPTVDALRLFADELNDETADLVVAQLILKADMRGSGLTAALEDLADSIHSEVRMRRQIETDRAGGRNEMRILTWMTMIALGVILLARDYAAPYSTPIGQLLLTLYIVIDGGMLLLARRISAAKPGPRVLVESKGAK